MRSRTRASEGALARAADGTQTCVARLGGTPVLCAALYFALHAALGTLNPIERDMIRHALKTVGARLGWRRG